MKTMADDRKTPDEPFLQRWARRKAEATAPDEKPAEAPVETASLDNPPPAPLHDETETAEIDPATLPDIDSLTEASDFSVFMQDGVPEALRTRALRRLWQVDPTFAHIDGLVEYGDDFTDVGVAAGAVSTLYKVGKGMLADIANEPDADAAASAPEDSTADDDAVPEPVPEIDTTANDTPDDPDKAG